MSLPSAGITRVACSFSNKGSSTAFSTVLRGQLDASLQTGETCRDFSRQKVLCESTKPKLNESEVQCKLCHLKPAYYNKDTLQSQWRVKHPAGGGACPLINTRLYKFDDTRAKQTTTLVSKMIALTIESHVKGQLSKYSTEKYRMLFCRPRRCGILLKYVTYSFHPSLSHYVRKYMQALVHGAMVNYFPVPTDCYFKFEQTTCFKKCQNKNLFL